MPSLRSLRRRRPQGILKAQAASDAWFGLTRVGDVPPPAGSRSWDPLGPIRVAGFAACRRQRQILTKDLSENPTAPEALLV